MQKPEYSGIVQRTALTELHTQDYAPPTHVFKAPTNNPRASTWTTMLRVRGLEKKVKYGKIMAHAP